MPDQEIMIMVEKKLNEYMTYKTKRKCGLGHNNIMGFLQLYV
jgi:hypothetical protein